MIEKYDEEYFLRGKESGKSLYENYRWLPELTKPMSERIADHLGIELADKILDFGCSRGYMVKALTELGYDASGIDISEWAISNCDESVKGKVSQGSVPVLNYDWIIAKDVLEHLTIVDLGNVLHHFSNRAKKGVFLVVPLSSAINHRYVVPEYEKDITHVIRWPLWRWTTEIHNIFDESWEICSRHLLDGVKDNYASWARGNGFITIRKI